MQNLPEGGHWAVLLPMMGHLLCWRLAAAAAAAACELAAVSFPSAQLVNLSFNTSTLEMPTWAEGLAPHTPCTGWLAVCIHAPRRE